MATYDDARDNGTYGSGPIFKNNETGQFLSVGYWESTMKLSFGNFTEGSGDYQKTTYDGTQNQVIGYHDISALYDACDVVSKQLDETGKFAPRGIRAGKKRNNILLLSPGTEYGMPSGIYLFLFKDLDSDNRTNTAAYYRFGANTQMVVRSYDAVSGTIEESPSGVLAEFKSFVKCVREAQSAFTNAHAYSIKHMMKDETFYTIRALAAVGRQMGLDSEIGASPRSNKKRSTSGPVPSWSN